MNLLSSPVHVYMSRNDVMTNGKKISRNLLHLKITGKRYKCIKSAYGEGNWGEILERKNVDLNFKLTTKKFKLDKKVF